MGTSLIETQNRGSCLFRTFDDNIDTVIGYYATISCIFNGYEHQVSKKETEGSSGNVASTLLPKIDPLPPISQVEA